MENNSFKKGIKDGLPICVGYFSVAFAFGIFSLPSCYGRCYIPCKNVSPLVLFHRKITNRFVLSLLQYVPIAVLSAMTVPAIFYASSSPLTALAGFAVAVIFAYFEKCLVQVAAFSCVAVFVAEMILKYI